jgi:hypothetical protein
MIKRNLSSVLIIIAMFLNILNFDFSNGIESKKFWLFLIALIILVASVVLIFITESKNNKKN